MNKELRKKLDLSQKEFSELLGCSKGQLAMAELGSRRLPENSKILLQQLLVNNIEEKSNKTQINTFTKPSSSPVNINAKVKHYLIKLIKSSSIKLEKIRLKNDVLKEKMEGVNNLLKLATSINENPLSEDIFHDQLKVYARIAMSKLEKYELQLCINEIEIASLLTTIDKANNYYIS